MNPSLSSSPFCTFVEDAILSTLNWVNDEGGTKFPGQLSSCLLFEPMSSWSSRPPGAAGTTRFEAFGLEISKIERDPQA